MNAYGYLRVSGTSQLEGTGFDRQLDACTRLADGKGFLLADSFREEAVTGTKGSESRPAFQAMIAAMVENDVSIVIVEDLSRLAREFRIQEQLLLYLASKNFQLYTANTGENITEALLSDPMRKAMVQIQGIFAELDKSLIVAKLKEGRKRTKAKVGRCEGQKPYGHYPEESVILASIMGKRQLGISSRAIALQLNASSIPTRTGAKWTGSVIAKIVRREKKHPEASLFSADLRPSCATIDVSIHS